MLNNNRIHGKELSLAFVIKSFCVISSFSIILLRKREMVALHFVFLLLCILLVFCFDA